MFARVGPAVTCSLHACGGACALVLRCETSSICAYIPATGTPCHFVWKRHSADTESRTVTHLLIHPHAHRRVRGDCCRAASVCDPNQEGGHPSVLQCVPTPRVSAGEQGRPVPSHPLPLPPLGVRPGWQARRNTADGHKGKEWARQSCIVTTVVISMTRAAALASNEGRH